MKKFWKTSLEEGGGEEREEGSVFNGPPPPSSSNPTISVNNFEDSMEVEGLEVQAAPSSRGGGRGRGVSWARAWGVVGGGGVECGGGSLARYLPLRLRFQLAMGIGCRVSLCLVLGFLLVWVCGLPRTLPHDKITPFNGNNLMVFRVAFDKFKAQKPRHEFNHLYLRMGRIVLPCHIQKIKSTPTSLLHLISKSGRFSLDRRGRQQALQ